MQTITRREYLRLAALASGGLAAGAIAGAAASALASTVDRLETIDMKDHYDALIVGGGPAGLSAALSLGRMLRTALVCDDDRPRNAPSTHLNNFASRDGIHPAEWRKEARRDLEKYRTIAFKKDSVASLERLDGGQFRAVFASGDSAVFRKVILADGIIDQLPEIPGFRELWGRSIFHCPYCHGFEVQGTALGLVGNGKSALHMAPLCFGLSKDLIIFTNGRSEFTEEQAAAFGGKGVRIVEDRIAALQIEEAALTAVVLEDGQKIGRTGLFFARSGPIQTKSDLGERLGCEKTEEGFYKVEEFGRTTVPGVFAAGDNMSRRQSVLHACGMGAVAASTVVSELLNEELND